jgi:hypothetical protein
LLHDQGDGYVSALMPWLVALGMIGLDGFLLLLANAPRDPRSERNPPRDPRSERNPPRRRIVVLWLGRRSRYCRLYLRWLYHCHVVGT